MAYKVYGHPRHNQSQGLIALVTALTLAESGEQVDAEFICNMPDQNDSGYDAACAELIEALRARLIEFTQRPMEISYNGGHGGAVNSGTMLIIKPANLIW